MPFYVVSKKRKLYMFQLTIKLSIEPKSAYLCKKKAYGRMLLWSSVFLSGSGISYLMIMVLRSTVELSYKNGT
jgi:hypothetical protein